MSSQVDVQGAQAKDGIVNVLASCEIEQAALQRLLYDLEAGMPYLFLEQVVAQAPQATAQPEGRMRLLLAVSGEWQGGKWNAHPDIRCRIGAAPQRARRTAAPTRPIRSICRRATSRPRPPSTCTAPTRPARPRGPSRPSGNPLWAIPLSSLTATRERPIFLPSRRAPAPAVAATPQVVTLPPPRACRARAATARARRRGRGRSRQLRGVHRPGHEQRDPPAHRTGSSRLGAAFGEGARGDARERAARPRPSRCRRPADRLPAPLHRRPAPCRVICRRQTCCRRARRRYHGRASGSTATAIRFRQEWISSNQRSRFGTQPLARLRASASWPRLIFEATASRSRTLSSCSRPLVAAAARLSHMCAST